VTVPAPDDAARRAWSAMCDLVLDNERRREVSEALGLSFGRAKALRRIARHPMTMGELATMLGIDAPYATLVVDELERQGLVERQPHPTDRRAKLVATTAEGSAAAKRAEEILARLPVGLADLPHADMETLARILESARTPAPQGDRSPDGSTKTNSTQTNSTTTKTSR
jgi:DNA-binding MarR family transcriptional regulator